MAKALAQPRRRGAPPRNDRSPAPSRAPRRVSAGEGSGPPPRALGLLGTGRGHASGTVAELGGSAWEGLRELAVPAAALGLRGQLLERP